MPSSRTARSVFLCTVLPGISAWLWTVLILGRALPWQASRWWIVTFLALFVLASAWSWPHWRKTKDSVAPALEWITVLFLGPGPFLLTEAAVLLTAYLSDPFNNLLGFPPARMQIVAGVAALTILKESVQVATVAWLLAPHSRAAAAGGALRDRVGLVLVACLSAVGVLQASAGATPLGDDIGHYREVADALLAGQSYPIPSSSDLGLSVGTGATYPALPVFPLLIAGSFSLFGRDLMGLALPTAMATALVPFCLYAALKAFTDSRPAAYLATCLVYLFPIYQIHVLGSPQPDTIFIGLLLVAAALGARADRRGGWSDWLGMGAVLGVASLTRHEGTAYSAVFFMAFFVVHRARVVCWLSLTTYLGVLAPFVALYHSLTGSYWPATFGSGVLRWDNVTANLAILQGQPLVWYAQAVGVDSATLVALVLAGFAVAASGTLALARRSLALAGIPAAGLGNIAAVFFMHPILVYSDFPPDFLRHISYGLALTTIALAYAGHASYRGIYRHLGKGRLCLPIVAVLLVSWLLYFQVDRLARPEWWFGGRASLLWTNNSSYLLADVAQTPVPLPALHDSRTGEQLREDLQRPLEGVNLAVTNRSEPYHSATLLIALLGVAYSLCDAIVSPLSLAHRRRRLTPGIGMIVSRMRHGPLVQRQRSHGASSNS